ncbi:hypothetical protein ABEV00_00620 [Paenibacillus thiaminolyticus]|uniref:hypothetical protein n=1 Tax=Paenibacillus TaxID=44249 RepID=UPI001409B1AC|nr:hypothetical protein [Paenibacillus dendritiformis]
MVVVILMCSGSFRSIHNYMNGPFEVEGEQLLSVVDPDDVYQFYVRFQADAIYEPIAEQVEWMSAFQGMMRSDEKAVYEYSLAQLTDHFVIIRHNVDEPIDDVLEGALFRVPADVYGIANELIDGERQVLPFMLDMTGALQQKVTQIFYTVTPVFLFAGFNMIRAMYRMTDRERHPIYKKLRTFGDADEAALSINQEMSNEVVQVKNYYVTPSWIIRQNWFTLKIARNYFEPDEVYDLDKVF